VRPVSEDIFQPIETGTPVPSIEFVGGHYVKKEHIVDGDVPIQTNKFYANFFLGGQGNPVWTHPYHLKWSKGLGETNSFGMAISHTERSQFAYGPNQDKPQYFISPVGINHMVLSAEELGKDTVLSVEDLEAFSVYANLAPSINSPVVMSLPCVQGMGMVTAIYNDAKPVVMSGVFFRSFDYIKKVSTGTFKWRTTLNDNSQWLVYVTPVGSLGVPPMKLENSSIITGPANFKGLIQVAKSPGGEAGEDSFDLAAGAYATNATISGSVNGGQGSYTIRWGKGGVQSKTLLMYALPHHVESFDQQTKGALKDIRLVTTTKGYAQAVLADKITMLENDLPDTIGFAPWAKNPNGAAGGSENVDIGSSALALVNNAAHAELSQDFGTQTNLNSMYYSGKGLAKFASMIYTVSNIAGNRNLAASGLIKLKDALNIFINNTQQEPLVYDKVWKGVVSGATYRPPVFDPGLDFGNTLYNDHHFHYGYFVYTAAVIGFLDPDWLEQGSNKQWINTLVRDYANPVTDEFFPFQRSFDWFHGHSWAKGLFESGDGKDQESTSEDTFATYAIKMWGKIIRDPNMEARGNLQLAVQARSIRNYFLLTKDNKNQPEKFLFNKVTGILFENKVDHTTYFGSNQEFIEGIHMIPLNPSSAYTRPAKFVQEEWDTYFNNGRADKVEGGWKAILYANYALVNPRKAYEYFSNPEFDTQLDGGASRTWYLAYTASLLGAQAGLTESDASLNYTTGTPGGGLEGEGTSNVPGEEGQEVPTQNEVDTPDEVPEKQPQESEIVPATPVPEKDDRKWPHGFIWPKKTMTKSFKHGATATSSPRNWATKTAKHNATHTRTRTTETRRTRSRKHSATPTSKTLPTNVDTLSKNDSPAPGSNPSTTAPSLLSEVTPPAAQGADSQPQDEVWAEPHKETPAPANPNDQPQNSDSSDIESPDMSWALQDKEGDFVGR